MPSTEEKTKADSNEDFAGQTENCKKNRKSADHL